MSEQKHTPGPLLKQIQDWVNLRRLDGTSSYSGGYNDGMDEVIGLVATYEKANGAAPELLQQVAELRKREKELVEALRARYEHLKWLKDVNTTPPSVIDEINFLQSLLSKFGTPNQS